jgi:long-subunit acyl-CoA synthetase (AMP-forming)
LISTHQPVSDAVIAAAISRANSRLPEYARVARWTRFPEMPTPGTGLLTANGRLRRETILERFGNCIDSLYDTTEHTSYVTA